MPVTLPAAFWVLSGLFCGHLSASQGAIPSVFVEESRSGYQFTTQSPDFTASFSRQKILLQLPNGTAQLRFPGASAHVSLESSAPLPGRVNFLVGRDPAEWHTHLATFGALIYRGLYSGIDLRYSQERQRLKSEFVVSAGANPASIRMRYEGLTASVAGDGALMLTGAAGSLREEAPAIYQMIGGRRVLVSGGFRILKDSSVGFHIESYDASRTLIIDPILTSSTYLGGSGQNSATAIRVDATGNIYVAGWTDAHNFPMANALRGTSGGGVDAFIAKLGPGGNSLVYCTYLGGSGDDRAFGLAVDLSGNAYVTGWTASPDFPTVGPLQSSRAGGRDAFVAKLNPAGSALVYSTFLGGNGNDSGNAIALDANGSAYVAGETASSNFPTLNPYQSSNRGPQNAFVARLSVSGASLIYSTYLGGNGSDRAAGIALDSSGNAYITGSTTSTSFPTISAFQPTSGGGQDAFAVKLDSSGNTLIYSTYLGGSGGTAGAPEGGQAIAIDSAGNAFVAGVTSSLNFPVTSGVLQTAMLGGGQDAFVVKLNSAGTALVYGTYLGGSSIDCANGIAVDAAGNAYVTGYTASLDFLTARATQAGNAGLYDAFLAKLNPAATSLLFSTYLGGSGSDSANAVAIDLLGNAFLAGQSLSPDFPTQRALQLTTSGFSAFVAKLSPGWKAAVFSGGTWYIDENRNGSFDGTATGDRILGFGQAGDIPVRGDWDGSGTTKIGVFRNGQWLLDFNGNGQWDGTAGGDRQYSFGQAGDQPVTGDWTGTGTTKIGVYRSGLWMLDSNGNGQWDGSPADVSFWLGSAQYLPVVGDWTGSRKARAGVFSGGWWYLDLNGDGQWTQGVDAVMVFGGQGDLPITGDWGSGVTGIGVFRSGFWILDLNGNGRIDGIGDAGFWFGNAQYLPVVLR